MGLDNLNTTVNVLSSDRVACLIHNKYENVVFLASETIGKL